MLSLPASLPSDIRKIAAAARAAGVLGTVESRSGWTIQVVVMWRSKVVWLSDPSEFFDIIWRTLQTTQIKVYRRRGYSVFLRVRFQTSHSHTWVGQRPLPFVIRMSERDEGTLSIVPTSAQASAVYEALRRDGHAFLKKRIKHKSLPTQPKGTLRPNPQTVTEQFRFYTESNGAVTVNTSQPKTVYLRSWSGTRTPGFASKNKASLPVNNHSVSLTINDDGYWTYQAKSLAPPGTQFWVAPYQSRFGTAEAGSEPPPLNHLVDASNHAIKRLASRSDSGIGGNIAQDLAQFGQIVSMVESTTERLIGAVGSLKKGNPGAAIERLWDPKRGTIPFKMGRFTTKTSSSAIANNWLEMQYGWKPLLSDIEGALGVLAQSDLFNPDAVNAKTVSSGAFRVQRDTIPIQGIYGGNKIRWGTNLLETKTVVKFGLRYRLQDRYKSYYSQLGFTNPLNLAWEVLPWSFVGDWFLPIGPWLESLSNFEGFQFVDGWKVQFTKRIATWQVSGSGNTTPADPGAQMHYFGNYQRTEVLFDRQKLTTFPSVTRPQVRMGLNVGRALNGVALVTQLFSRKA